jgi:hypothetical protein
MLTIDKKNSWQRMYMYAEVKIIKFHDKNMFWTMCYKPNFMTAKFKRSKKFEQYCRHSRVNNMLYGSLFGNSYKMFDQKSYCLLSLYEQALAFAVLGKANR